MMLSVLLNSVGSSFVFGLYLRVLQPWFSWAGYSSILVELVYFVPRIFGILFGRVSPWLHEAVAADKALVCWIRFWSLLCSVLVEVVAVDQSVPWRGVAD